MVHGKYPPQWGFETKASRSWVFCLNHYILATFINLKASFESKFYFEIEISLKSIKTSPFFSVMEYMIFHKYLITKTNQHLVLYLPNWLRTFCHFLLHQLKALFNWLCACQCYSFRRYIFRCYSFRRYSFRRFTFRC